VYDILLRALAFFSKEGGCSMVYDLQKASFWKRISAWLFDNILVSILAVGIAFLFSALLGYNQYSDRVENGYARYEAEYGVSFDVSQQEYQNWTEDMRANYEAAYQALIADEAVLHAYNMVVNLTMMITSLSILLAVLLWEFVLPLILKNGQTLGKKIFGLCLVRSDCVRINNLQLFVRTVLGKYAIETMIPVYILLMLFWGITDLSGTLILVALAVAEILILALNRRNAAIHDLLAGTAVVDYSSQMIFSSTEDLIEFQKKVHAERAARQEY